MLFYGKIVFMKKKNYKIGVFDSGIGGITTLKEIRKLMPNESFIYYLDNKNIPYGNKSEEELDLITENIIEFFHKKKVKAIVIACNTATTRCVHYLRDKYKDDIIVGTEPAIKVACDKGYKNTLLLVTPLTAKSDRLFELINDNARSDQNITVIPCFGLADTIESKNKNKIKLAVYNLLYEYKMYDYDSIVLGCTHYIYIKKLLKELFPNAKQIDGNKGVSRELKRRLTENDLLTDRKTKGTVEYVNSKDL